LGVVPFQERPCLGPRQQLCVGRPVKRLTIWRSRAAFCQRSGRLFRDPIAQFQVFPYFAAFVAVLFRFIWPVIDLSEGVFGVANYVCYYIEVFRHGLHPLLCILEPLSAKRVPTHPENSHVVVLTLPSRLAKLFQDNPTTPIVKCSTGRRKVLCILGESHQRNPSRAATRSPRESERR